MATSLTCLGVFWAFFSLIASLLCCVGFYMPYWIKGELLDEYDTYFGSFRRCNYPRVSAFGEVQIIQECGRYTTFYDIPSAWWQIVTVLIAVAAILSLLVAFTACAALCLTYVIHDLSARVAGSLQLLAFLLMLAGGALYPLGWDNREVKEACGYKSAIYDIGTCQLSWSIYILTASAGLLFLCFCMSFCASRYKSSSFRS